jgi:hypothetical protein
MMNEMRRIASVPAYIDGRQEVPRPRPVVVERKPVAKVLEEVSYTPRPLAPLRPLDLFRPREPSRVTVQIANTPELMDIVYRLRHDSYVAQGFLEPKVSGLFADDWDQQPHFFSVLCFIDGRPAASVRISYARPAAPFRQRTETTAMEIFKTEIETVSQQFQTETKSAVVMELSRLTRHPDFSESNSDPLFAVFRVCFYSLIKYEADMLISAVRGHHMPFYRRMGFQKITEPRPYPKLKFDTALMVCFGQSFGAVQKSLPIFQGIDPNDSVYARLFAGERVRIFDEMPERAAVR